MKSNQKLINSSYLMLISRTICPFSYFFKAALIQMRYSNFFWFILMLYCIKVVKPITLPLAHSIEIHSAEFFVLSSFVFFQKMHHAKALRQILPKGSKSKVFHFSFGGDSFCLFFGVIIRLLNYRIRCINIIIDYSCSQELFSA